MQTFFNRIFEKFEFILENKNCSAISTLEKCGPRLVKQGIILAKAVGSFFFYVIDFYEDSILISKVECYDEILRGENPPSRICLLGASWYPFLFLSLTIFFSSFEVMGINGILTASREKRHYYSSRVFLSPFCNIFLWKVNVKSRSISTRLK